MEHLLSPSTANCPCSLLSCFTSGPYELCFSHRPAVFFCGFLGRLKSSSSCFLTGFFGDTYSHCAAMEAFSLAQSGPRVVTSAQVEYMTELNESQGHSDGDVRNGGVSRWDHSGPFGPKWERYFGFGILRARSSVLEYCICRAME